jgi:hypothetical protein
LAQAMSSTIAAAAVSTSNGVRISPTSDSRTGSTATVYAVLDSG